MRIDWWTLALQAVNFLVLLWLLKRFLYGPVTEIVRRRQAAAQKLLDDAARVRRDAESERADIAKTRQELTRECDKLLAAARADAQSAKKAILAHAGEEAEKLQRAARDELARASATRRRADATHAEELAVAIAGKLLSRLKPGGEMDAFLDGFCAELTALPSSAKAALKDDAAIEIATAGPLPPAARKRIEDALHTALGMVPPLHFHTDPAVIGGIELTAENIVLRNSWREDLNRIAEELARDGD